MISHMSMILLAHGSQTEMTANPFWFVAKRSPGGLVILAGIWFNRDDAEHYLKEESHQCGPSAFVHCASGKRTSCLDKMYRIANAEARAVEVGGE